MTVDMPLGQTPSSPAAGRLPRPTPPWIVAFALAAACTGEDATGVGGGGGDAGGTRCDARGCWVSLEEFQSVQLRCEGTLDEARAAHPLVPGPDCSSAFFECEGFRAVAYQYGFTGDNVQCYYGPAGGLVGAVRTSDHGPSTLAGTVPESSCHSGPDCDAADAGA